MGIEEIIKQKYEALKPFMDERVRRLWAVTEAKALGYGGIAIVVRATGMSRNTIVAGREELEGQASSAEPPAPWVRRPGGGRKRLSEKDPTLLWELESLVEPHTRGEPDSPLCWTCKSSTVLAEELQGRGHPVSERSVCRLLHQLGYSLQANSKVREMSSHPDRNEQFEHINEEVKEFQGREQPVVSVDTKKKELVGDFKNSGKEWRPQGEPEAVRVHDFEDKELGKAIPYGIYDLTTDEGWVSVGVDHDTAEFAAETLRRWWCKMGKEQYPEAKDLLVVADAGGSNGYRIRLWKRELQQFADETGLQVSASHLPPGTSKWNRIEHRMFSFITKNWRGRPLVSHEVIVNLIANTRTRAGLRIDAALDTNAYPKGLKVTDQEFAQLRIERDGFHDEWNYTIVPRNLNI